MTRPHITPGSEALPATSAPALVPLGHLLPARRATTRSPTLAAAALTLAAAVTLALEPVVWLWTTWTDPSYASSGAVVAVIVAALALWSARSARGEPTAPGRRILGITLLAISALVRLAGQLLAIRTIGALTLVVDVLALGLLLELDRRRHAVSPVWLAIAFTFALPLERIAQRSIGHLLQLASADGACALLSGIFDRVTCAGVRIVIDGRDVLVDLPCSGARTILITLLAFAIVAAVTRPHLLPALAGALIALASAFAANVLRITALATGIAHPETIGGIDVMAPPWHDAIGLSALVLALLPLLAWSRFATRGFARPAPAPRVCPVFGVRSDRVPDAIHRDGWWLAIEYPGRPGARPGGARSLPLALAALAAAIVIVNLPAKPLDVARREAPIALPAWLSGIAGEEVALSAREQSYFTQFGGAAAKRTYGPHSLLVVRTTSPLRHLHAPDECLRGLGFAVRYVGLAESAIPTAVYAATSPDGRPYRIDVTFVSDAGHTASNVATAVWHWLNGDGHTWSAIQRISPADLDPDRHRQWSAAALAALGVAPEPAPHTLASKP